MNESPQQYNVYSVKKNTTMYNYMQKNKTKNTEEETEKQRIKIKWNFSNTILEIFIYVCTVTHLCWIY